MAHRPATTTLAATWLPADPMVTRVAGASAHDPSLAAPSDVREAVVGVLTERRDGLERALAALSARTDALAAAAATLVEALRAGHKVLIAGNGGSAAEAQHFAAELVGRFKREREPYAVIALTADTAVLTAVANDYGYADVFARQVAALACPGDVLLLFSTSGESENVVRAAQMGRQRGMGVVAITGTGGCRLHYLADVVVEAGDGDAAAVQEMHVIVTHVLCDIVESTLVAAVQGPSGDGESVVGIARPGVLDGRTL